MKRIIFVYIFIAIFLLPIGAQAALWDRGGGLIYDDVLDITWLQDANYSMTSGYDSDGMMTWDNALIWADQLSYSDSVRNQTLTNWRLPKIEPLNGISYTMDANPLDGSNDGGFNISAPGSTSEGSTASEMAYMYYNNLDNIAYRDFDGNIQPDYGLRNTGPFLNLLENVYWSGNDNPENDAAWEFIFINGGQSNYPKYLEHYAWAVMDGDVAAVPIPGAVWLLGSGLVGLFAVRRRKT